MPFIPHTEDDVATMLARIGVDSIEALFDEIPAALRSRGLAGIPPAQSEMELLRLAAARPVVVSQLLAEYLSAHAAFSRDEVARAVAARVRSLPTTLFVDPDLARDPERLVDQSLRELLRLRILVRDGENYRLGPGRTAPSFPLADDIVAYQAAFFAETLAADAALRALAAPPPLVGGG